MKVKLLHFACVAVLAGVAPPLAHRALAGWGGGTSDEVHSVKVDRFPVVLVDAEVEALVASL